MDGFDRESLDGPAAGYVADGLAFLLTDRLHLDVNAGSRPGSDQPARALGIGFKTRW